MLSRHAEGLFWMGRYVERAAYITRMLDVAYHKQLELSSRSPAQVWHDLLHVLYLEEEFARAHRDDPNTATVNRFLVFDAGNRSSVLSSAAGARTNVMNVRDVVPIELLETVNRLYTQVESGSLDPFVERSPHEIYETVSGLCRAITGAMEETMPRGDGYRFLVMGRMLERAEMTCRMIDVNRTVSGTDTSAWMTVLRSVSGFHAFMQTSGPLAPADDVVRFMLLEPSFPFGVLHCLRRTATLAGEVQGSTQWASPRMAGRLTAELEYAELPAVDHPDLELLLDQLEEGIRVVSEALHHDLYQLGGDPLLYSFEAV